MNISVWLQRIAQVQGGRGALFLGAREVADYAAFYRHAGQVAAWLAQNGVLPGGRVAIFMKNLPDYLPVQYGIWMAGAVAVPINAKLHGREAAWIIGDCGADICFASSGLAGDLRAALDGDACRICDVSGDNGDHGALDYRTVFECRAMEAPISRAPQDLAWLFYTSGTTGRPKGVMINFGMLTGMAMSYFVDADHVSREDSALYAAPLSHGAGIYNLMHVMVGARHIFPESGGFDEAEIFDLAKIHGRVHMFAAPTMVKRMTQVAKAMGENGAGLRSVVYAGGPMYRADIIEAVDHFGDIFIQIYGQGECPMGITALSREDVSDRTHPRWQERLGSVGRAQSGVEVRIGDADGCAVPMGDPGEIMVRGNVVMPGYWGNPGASAQTLRGGWLWTGDIGHMDVDGYVTMQDRSKDMIISGGSNIYPREVEEVLISHPCVEEVSVVGRRHDEWGEDVVAFVVLAEKLGAGFAVEADLGAHCLDHIARFKRPKAYFVLQALPKNNYGKVLKTQLRDMLAAMTP